MTQEATEQVGAAPDGIIPGSRSSVNLGPDYDRGVIVWAGPDGHIFVSAHGRPAVELTDTTSAAPSVAVLPDGRVCIAFAANDLSNAIHIGQFNGTPSLQAGSMVHVNGVVQTTAAGPALAADPGTGVLYLAWAGTDRAHHLNFLISGDGGLSWRGPVVTTQDTVAWAPTLAIRDGEVYVGWTGTDPHNRPNVGRYVRTSTLDKGGVGVLYLDEAPGGTRVVTDGTRLLALFSTNTQQRWVQCCLDVEHYPLDEKIIFSDPPEIRSYTVPDVSFDNPAQPQILWTGTDGQVNEATTTLLGP